jgi:hypothetical protein
MKIPLGGQNELLGGQLYFRCIFYPYKHKYLPKCAHTKESHII